MKAKWGRVVALGDRVPQGSTFPVYGTVETPEGERVEAVLKFATFEKRVPPEAILNEWVATKCAEAVGLQVAPCWLVDLSESVRQRIESRFRIGVASQLGFASHKVPIDSFVYPTTFTEAFQEDALRLFLFDMVFLNTDRIPDNPNCGRVGERLFSFDFGSALPSPKSSSSRFDRFFFPPNLVERAQSHLCRGMVSDASPAIRILPEMIQTLASQGESLIDHLPHGDHANLLALYFRFLSDERKMIVQQVVGVL